MLLFELSENLYIYFLFLLQMQSVERLQNVSVVASVTWYSLTFASLSKKD